jgi:hypothetical protein
MAKLAFDCVMGREQAAVDPVLTQAIQLLCDPVVSFIVSHIFLCFSMQGN